jgi:excinuclease ABC subunit C
MEIKKKLEETDAELLELAIIELRERFQLSRSYCPVPG